MHSPSLLFAGETPERFIETCVPVYNPDTSSAIPAAPEMGPHDQQLGATVLRVVLWTHTNRNGRAARELLRDCDVIAEEAVEADPDIPLTDENVQRLSAERELWFAARSYVTGYPTSEATRDELKSHGIIPKSAGAVPPYRWAKRQLARHYHGILKPEDGPKNIVGIDIGPANLETHRELRKSTRGKEQAYWQRVRQNTGNWQDHEGSFMTFLEAEAKEMDFRESVTRDQVGELISNHPGKTIGIVYGSYHQLITRQLDYASDNGVTMERFFVMDADASKRTSTAYHTHRAIASYGIRAGLPIETYQNYIDRCLLSDVFLTNQKVRQALLYADPEQVDGLLSEVQQVYSQRISERAEDRVARMRALGEIGKRFKASVMAPQ